MASLILPTKFLDVLPAFTCARAIGNLSLICLEVNILRSFPCFASYLVLDRIVV